jgi:hypothetical protein
MIIPRRNLPARRKTEKQRNKMSCYSALKILGSAPDPRVTFGYPPNASGNSLKFHGRKEISGESPEVARESPKLPGGN